MGGVTRMTLALAVIMMEVGPFGTLFLALFGWPIGCPPA